jgi:hypothetical protein
MNNGDFNMDLNNNSVPDNHEASMARADLYKLANYSMKLFKMIQEGEELEGWVQAKITKAADYIASVYHYMEYELKTSEYGNHLESAEMYSESVRRAFQQKLMEAKAAKEKIAKDAKKKLSKDEKVDEGWDDMVKAGEKRKNEKGTGKFDKKELSTGTQYTRKSSTFDDGGKDKDQKKAEKKAKATTEGFGDFKSDKEKGTGKFDKKEIKPGVTQYTRKSSTFTDGGKDSDQKKSEKKAKKTEEGVVSELSKGTLKSYAKKASLDSIMRMGKAATDGDHKEAEKAGRRYGGVVKAVDRLAKEGVAKPDFLDIDKDGDKKEPMKQAAKKSKTDSLKRSA